MSDLTDQLAAEMEDSPGPPPATLENIQALGAEVNTLDERIARGETLMSELRARRNQIITREMVEMMDAANVEAITVAGRTFETKPYYKASIPEEHRDAAHTWLEEHEAGDLITYELVVSFPKDCQEEAERLERYARENFQMAEVSKKRAVPWARLTSWLREMFEKQDETTVLPPLEIMGATVGRVVKIKEPKKSAQKDL